MWVALAIGLVWTVYNLSYEALLTSANWTFRKGQPPKLRRVLFGSCGGRSWQRADLQTPSKELRCELAHLKAFIANLKSVSPDERQDLLNAVVVSDQHVRMPRSLSDEPEQEQPAVPERSANECDCVRGDGRRASTEHDGTEAAEDSSAEEPDLASFASVDETGRPSSFGPSSALNQPPERGLGHPHRGNGVVNDAVRNSLIANATLQRGSKSTALPRCLRSAAFLPTSPCTCWTCTGADSTTLSH